MSSSSFEGKVGVHCPPKSRLDSRTPQQGGGLEAVRVGRLFPRLTKGCRSRGLQFPKIPPGQVGGVAGKAGQASPVPSEAAGPVLRGLCRHSKGTSCLSLCQACSVFL